eukprot:10011139-Prorocentrum_lima.AAC.1
MATTLHQVQNNRQVAQALDWVSAIGGTKAGVYILYGHPGCDWKLTLQNPNNVARLDTSNPA